MLLICPSCQAKLQVVRPISKTIAKCPKCGERFPVPILDTTPPNSPTVTRQRDSRRHTDTADIVDKLPDSSWQTHHWVLLGVVTFVLAVGGFAAGWFVLAGKSVETASPLPALPAEAEGPPAPTPPTPVAEAPPDAETAKKIKQPPTGPEIYKYLLDQPLTGPEIYKYLLHSAAFIVKPSRIGPAIAIGIGSGVVVHLERRLVLTNHHVAKRGDEVALIFPAYDHDGSVITNINYYLTNIKSHGRLGRVLRSDPQLDLAIIEVDSLPAEVRAIPIAAKPADTGALVYTIGNSSVKLTDENSENSYLWRFSTGTVRGRSRMTGLLSSGQIFDGMVLETQAPLNPGDSGGPVVNDHAELVAVVSHGDSRSQLVSGNVDLVEIRLFLTRHAEAAGFKWQDATPFTLLPTQTDILPQQLARLQTEDPSERAEAIAWIGRLGNKARRYLPDLLAAADPPAPAVDQALTVALAQIGPPTTADVAALGRAVTGSSLPAKRYALTAFATSLTAPKEIVEVLAKMLHDPDPVLRKQAATALGRYGSGAKTVALADLLQLSGHEDDEIAAAAAEAVKKMRPYKATDARFFEAVLDSPSIAIRYTALREMAELLQSGEAVVRLFTPYLFHNTAALRALSVRALAAWPEGHKTLRKHYPILTLDADAEVRIETARALAAGGWSPDTVERLINMLERERNADARSAQTTALLDLAHSEADKVRVYQTLLRHGDPAAWPTILAKVADLSEAGLPFLPLLGNLLTTPDPTVQVGVIRVVAAIGPKASDWVDKIADLVPRDMVSRRLVDAELVADGRLSVPPASDGDVGREAIAALGRLGPAGVKGLMRVGDRPGTTTPVKTEVCKALATTGEPGRAATGLLLAWAESSVELRSSAGVALAALGGDKIAQELIDRTEFRIILRGNREEERVPAAIRGWAIETIGQLDMTTLSPEVQRKVIERMNYLAKYERHLGNRGCAAYIATKLKDAIR
jgi:HEAT repeat protein